MSGQLKFRTSTTLFFAALFATLAVAQTSLLHADFNQCNLPSGWTVNLGGTSPADWVVTDLPQNPNTNGLTIDGTCMAILDDEMASQNEAAGIVQFISPPFDASAHPAVNFSVDVHFQSWEQSKFSIYAFDGSRYVLLKKFQGEDSNTGPHFSDFITFSADLSFFAHEKMRLLFEFDDGGGEARHAGFDNVKVTGSGQGTNVLLETFNFCSKPNGWDAEVLTGDRNWNFSIFYNDDTDTVSLDGSCFASFDDDGIGNSLEAVPPSRVMLLSPWVDGTAFARFTLSFDLIFQKKLARERIEVGVWDGAELRLAGSFFDETGGPLFENFAHQSIDISLLRAEEFRVVFIYDDGGGWGKWAGIDNVKITGEGAVNDLCETAFTIHLNEKCRPGSNFTAFLAGSQPACLPPFSPAGDDQAAVNAVWFRYPAAKTGFVRVSTGAGFNDLLTVYEGTCTGGITSLCTNRDEFGFTGETACFEAQAGVEYFIRVSAIRGAFGLEFGELCIELMDVEPPPPGPPNDSCHLALPLAVGEECVAGDNFNASFSSVAPGADEKPRSDVWYRFEAPGDAVEILSNARFSDVICLYSGTCGMLVPQAVQESGRQLIARNLTPGQEYFIQISGSFATVEGVFCVQIKPYLAMPPANDHCEQAQPLTVGVQCETAMISADASASGPKPSCSENAGPNVWFSFQAPASGSVKFNTEADFPTIVAFYSGECDQLAELKCFKNPLPCDGLQLLEMLHPGETYFVQVAVNTDFFSGETGGGMCFTLFEGNTESIIPLGLSATVDCLGEGIGKLNVEISGGLGNIVLQGNANGEILHSGDTFLVVASDENGCEKSVFGIAQCGAHDCPMTAILEVNDVSCSGLATGSAMVVTQHETGALSYLWSNGQEGPFVAGLEPGPISVTVTDEGGCAVLLDAEVKQPEPLAAQISATPESAFQANDGTVAANISGGTPPFQFQWSNGSTSQAQSGLPPGIYTVTINDANHCQTTMPAVVVPYVCDFSGNILKQNITCHGGSNGAAAAVPTSGTPPFSFFWSNGKTTPSVNNLPPGIVAVTVTDAAGCTGVFSVQLEQPGLFAANANALNGSSSATANPSGGTPPYSFFWSNNQILQTISGVAPGVYTVTVTDANGCIAVGDVNVNEPDCSLSASIQEVELVSCHGGSDGFATISANGGTPPLNFSWPDGSTGASKTGLAAGAHEVTVTDASQCSVILTVSVDQPPPLSGIVLNATDVICEGESSGEMTVSGSGGASPYQYFWSGGGSGATQTGLAYGPHTVGIEDANGCNYLMDVAIGIDDPLPPVVSVKNIVLELNENGKVTLTPALVDNGSFDNCGIAGYALSQTNFTCNQVGQHLVMLTVTDVNGNTNSGTATVTVVDNTLPVLLCPEDIFSNHCNFPIEYDQPALLDNCLAGEAVLTEGLPSGSVFPLGETIVAYELSNDADLAASCRFKVVVENTLAGSVKVLPPSCFGHTDGTASISVFGGTGNFNFLWNDVAGQTSATASGLPAGIYQVTVTDEGGCTFEAEAIVPQPPELLLTIDGTVAASSPGTADGNILISVAGGVPPYFFEWKNAAGQLISTAEDPTGLPGGEYHVRITDGNGCEISSVWIPVETLTGTAGASDLERFVLVYPNPAKEAVFVKYLLKGNGKTSFELIDVAGRKISSATTGSDLTATGYRLDLGGLPEGVYLLKIIAGNEVAIKKVVVAN